MFNYMFQNQVKKRSITMGWAKYFEDDLEIMFERQYMMQEKEHESSFIITYSKSIIPISKNSNKNNQQTNHTQKQYENKYLICQDCGKRFLFSAKSQKYFKSKGWNEPIRCKECRDIKNIRFLMASSF